MKRLLVSVLLIGGCGQQANPSMQVEDTKGSIDGDSHQDSIEVDSNDAVVDIKLIKGVHSLGSLPKASTVVEPIICTEGYSTSLTGDCLPDCAILCASKECGTAGADNECTCGECPVVAEQCAWNTCLEGTCALTALNDIPCADGNPCTENDTCKEGICKGTPLTQDEAAIAGCACKNAVDCKLYGDSNVCTGLAYCDAGVCALTAPLDCSNTDPCWVGGCDPLSGCIMEMAMNGTPCGNDNPCDGIDTCYDGACQIGGELDCDDNNPCTEDGCNPETGCYSEPLENGTSCDTDLDPCNGIDTCNDGVCMVTEIPLDCNDGNPCTMDLCNTVVGCQHTLLSEGTICGSGLYCTIDGECVCVPNCDGKKCGGDGCGGSCGSCGKTQECQNFKCVCIPVCDGKECGSDGCGGSCGTCGCGETCQINGECLFQACDGKECGSDGCGGSCGSCGANATCLEGFCCVPDCTGKVCGDDGCGGSCGTCVTGDCTIWGTCVSPTGMATVPMVMKYPVYTILDTKPGYLNPSSLKIPYSYKVDKTPVTVEQYSACVDAGVCTDEDYQPKCQTSLGGPYYIPGSSWTAGVKDAAMDANWQQAKDYCEWAGKRLCSKSEWQLMAYYSPKVVNYSTPVMYPWCPTLTPMYCSDLDACAKMPCYEITNCEPDLKSVHPPVTDFPLSTNYLGVTYWAKREYVEDCWHSDLSGMPNNGDPWITDCDLPATGVSITAGHMPYGTLSDGGKMNAIRCCDDLE